EHDGTEHYRSRSSRGLRGPMCFRPLIQASIRRNSDRSAGAQTQSIVRLSSRVLVDTSALRAMHHRKELPRSFVRLLSKICHAPSALTVKHETSHLLNVCEARIIPRKRASIRKQENFMQQTLLRQSIRQALQSARPIAALATFGLLTSPAFAQDAQDQSDQKLETITVTGSNIRRVDIETYNETVPSTG